MISRSISDNGIRIITEKIPFSYSVSIGIWVNNGSRHEAPHFNGIAHFIEHLLFKGTSRRSALDIAREIDSVGGVLNAFTGREYVCYYAKVLDRFLPRASDLLSDIFLNSLFNAEEIERERKVILQEISMLEDTPDDYIHDVFHQNFWKGHPLGMSVLGSEESVSSLSRDILLDYKARNYSAEDIIITAAGNVEHDQVVALFEELVASSSVGTARGETHRPVYEKKLDMIERDLEQVHLCLGTKGIAQNNPSRFEAFILNTILGGSMGSRLFQEVREKKGLAYSIYSYMASHSDAGSMVVYAGTSPEKIKEVIDITLREISHLKITPVTIEELSSAREQLKGNLLLSLESSDNRMTKLAKNEIYFGRYQTLEEIMDGFDAVTVDSLQELAQEFFDDSFFTLELMGRVDGLNLALSDIAL